MREMEMVRFLFWMITYNREHKMRKHERSLMWKYFWTIYKTHWKYVFEATKRSLSWNNIFVILWLMSTTIKYLTTEFRIYRETNKDRRKCIRNIQRGERKDVINYLKRWNRKTRVLRNETPVLEVYGRSNVSDKLYKLNEEYIQIGGV